MHSTNNDSHYSLVAFLFTSNTHFQVHHTHFYSSFAFSDVFLTNLLIKQLLILSPENEVAEQIIVVRAVELWHTWQNLDITFLFVQFELDVTSVFITFII